LNEKEESNRVVEYYDTSSSTIKSETINSRASVSGLLQQRKKEKSTNCAGMLLYEEENEGDGLIAHYYDNEAWLGDFKERKDPTKDILRLLIQENSFLQLNVMMEHH